MNDGREDLLRGELKIKQPLENEGPRVNIDTILLAHFTKPKKGEKILEIGCAHGAVSLILAKRGHIVEGVDIQPHLIEMAAENAVENGLEDKAKFYTGDIRDHRKIWEAQSFDRVAVNPPYFEKNSGSVSPSTALATALNGLNCTLEDLVQACRYLLKNKGYLDIVIHAGRTGELIALLDKYNIAPKKLRTVHPRPGAEASVVLIEAVRASKHGLRIEAPLFVLDEEGKETPQLLEAYRTGGK
ncbi:MAG: methyltransferase domain-containing protein [Mesotoga sp.]|uniref:tRNA1(Val) (adenine(37)-N6)-methyltransferase n=1 Tax=Mesotoga sp. TaxID=2053577 RepID=UPI003562A540